MAYDAQEILYEYATAKAWPVIDGDWVTDRAVRITAAEEGSGTIVGSASGMKTFGRKMEAYDTSIASVPITTSQATLGRYCRLLRPDGAGTISRFSKTWTEFWWGFNGRIKTQFKGDGGATSQPQAFASYDLIGLAGLLEQVVCVDGYDGNSTAAHPWNIYVAPDFNANGLGNRTTGTWTINSRAVYVFDFENLGSASTWTVANALDYLLEAFTLPHGGGGTWTFVDATASAGTKVLPPTPIHGKTLLEAINSIANPRRGLTYKIAMGAGNRPRLTLMDWKPASGTAITATAKEWTTVEIEEDTTTTCDHGLILSQRPPITTLDLNYKTSGSPLLAPDGWTFGPPPENDPNSQILRRWKLGVNILDNLRVDLHKDGSNAYDGVRNTAASIGGGPSCKGIELERLTGLRTDQITTTIAALTDIEDRSSIRVMCKGSSTVAASWEDWTTLVSISVSNQPARITLHASDDVLADLYTLLNGGGEMRIVLGIREIAPWRYSSRQTDSYRGTREIAREIHGVDEHYVVAGTAVAVDGSHNIVTAAANTETWDGVSVPLLAERQRLADSRIRDRHVSVNLEKTGLDFTTLPAGTMISTIDPGPGAITVNAIVTNRIWDFDNLRTKFNTVRASAAIE